VIVQLQGVMDRDMRLGGLSLFEVWQKRESDAVQHLARAFVERVCLEQFLAEAAANKKLGLMLEKLAVLFALDSIEKDATWFLTSRVFSVDVALSADKASKELCAQLAPQALHLVDAFSVPEHLLPPAARDWVKYNEVDNNGELLGQPF
jgi:acyl-CoA oxidase